jgi:hypothetical protein
MAPERRDEARRLIADGGRFRCAPRSILAGDLYLVATADYAELLSRAAEPVRASLF